MESIYYFDFEIYSWAYRYAEIKLIYELIIHIVRIFIHLKWSYIGMQGKWQKTNVFVRSSCQIWLGGICRPVCYAFNFRNHWCILGLEKQVRTQNRTSSTFKIDFIIISIHLIHVFIKTSILYWCLQPKVCCYFFSGMHRSLEMPLQNTSLPPDRWH